MPAAAVIPAPIAYIKVVAVKKLVVGFLARTRCSLLNGSAVSVSVSSFYMYVAGFKTLVGGV